MGVKLYVITRPTFHANLQMISYKKFLRKFISQVPFKVIFKWDKIVYLTERNKICKYRSLTGIAPICLSLAGRPCTCHDSCTKDSATRPIRSFSTPMLPQLAPPPSPLTSSCFLAFLFPMLHCMPV